MSSGPMRTPPLSRASRSGPKLGDVGLDVGGRGPRQTARARLVVTLEDVSGLLIQTLERFALGGLKANDIGDVGHANVVVVPVQDDVAATARHPAAFSLTLEEAAR